MNDVNADRIWSQKDWTNLPEGHHSQDSETGLEEDRTFTKMGRLPRRMDLAKHLPQRNDV